MSKWLRSLIYAKNERFAQKTDERIPSPANFGIEVLQQFGTTWKVSNKFILFLVVSTNLKKPVMNTCRQAENNSALTQLCRVEI